MSDKLKIGIGALVVVLVGVPPVAKTRQESAHALHTYNLVYVDGHQRADAGVLGMRKMRWFFQTKR